MKFNLREISGIVLNKSPKIILIVLILFGLSLHADSLFGVSYGSASGWIQVPQNLVNERFGTEIELSTVDSVYFEVFNSHTKQKMGSMVLSQRFASVHKGYGGQTPVAIFLTPNNVITAVELLDNHETPRFIKRLANQKFFERFVGQRIESDFSNVDAVSGATYSSVSIIANVGDALSAVVKSNRGVQSSDFVNYLKQFAVLAVVVAALLAMLFPMQAKRFRPLLLGATIAVLGIWQGAFVSLELLYHWLIYGTSFAERFALISIVCLAVFLPLLFGKSFYCQYLCPFGAAQELTGKLFSRKINISRPVLKTFHWIRRITLVCAVILLISGTDFNLSDMEPFTIFLINSASLSTIIIASLSLLGSLFFFRPWCRLLCPTGEFIALFARKLKFRKS